MAKQSYPRLDFSRMQPYLLQREIMEHPARFKVVAFGRQSGKSWLARRIALHKSANEGKIGWWVAPTYQTAQPHWLELNRLLRKINFPVASLNKSDKFIEFYSGGFLQIKSAEIPDNLRGGTLDYIIIDEAAFMHEDVWYKVLQPMITASKGDVIFLSTPNGQNWFYLLYLLGQNPDYPDFMSWRMPSTQSPYQDKKLLETIRQTVPEAVWREEYLAEFLADSGGVFAGLDRIVPHEMLYKPLSGHVYVAGVDWGLDDDYTVFTVADKYERRQVYGERFNTIGTVEQTDRIIELIQLWKPAVVNIEMNGVGSPLFKLLKSRYNARVEFEDAEGNYVNISGGTRIRGVYMTNAKKRHLIETYAAAIEWGRFIPLVRMSETDSTSFGAIQMSEMSTFQRKRTASGLEITYGAAEGYKDDTVMAGALMFAGVGDVSLDSETVISENNARDRRDYIRADLRSPFQIGSVRPRNIGRENTRRNWRRLA